MAKKEGKAYHSTLLVAYLFGNEGMTLRTGDSSFHGATFLLLQR
jgi:hypothetical protein